MSLRNEHESIRREVMNRLANNNDLNRALKNAGAYDEDQMLSVWYKQNKSDKPLNFDYVSFMFNDKKFKPHVHCDKSLSLAWEFFQGAFTPGELKKNGFTSKLFSDEGRQDFKNRDKLKQAVMIWSVCVDYIKEGKMPEQINPILGQKVLNGQLSQLCKTRQLIYDDGSRDVMSLLVPTLPVTIEKENLAEAEVLENKALFDEWLKYNYKELSDYLKKQVTPMQSMIRDILIKTYYYYAVVGEHNDKVKKVTSLLSQVVKLESNNEDIKGTVKKCGVVAKEMCKSPAKSILYSIGLSIDKLKAAIQRVFGVDEDKLYVRHNNLFQKKHKHDAEKRLHGEVQHLAKELSSKKGKHGK